MYLGIYTTQILLYSFEYFSLVKGNQYGEFSMFHFILTAINKAHMGL